VSEKKEKKNAEKVSRLFSTVSAKGSKKVILSEKMCAQVNYK